MKITLEIEGVDTVNLNDLVGQVLEHLRRTAADTANNERERNEVLERTAVKVLSSLTSVWQAMEASKGARPQRREGYHTEAGRGCRHEPGEKASWYSDEDAKSLRNAWIASPLSEEVARSKPDWDIILTVFVSAFQTVKADAPTYDDGPAFGRTMLRPDDITSFVQTFVNAYDLSVLVNYIEDARVYVKETGGIAEALTNNGLDESDLDLFRDVVFDAGFDAWWSTGGNEMESGGLEPGPIITPPPTTGGPFTYADYEAQVEADRNSRPYDEASIKLRRKTSASAAVRWALDTLKEPRTRESVIGRAVTYCSGADNLTRADIDEALDTPLATYLDARVEAVPDPVPDFPPAP